MPRHAVPLVGRAAELADLTATVHAAAGGTGSALIVGGDAGVGKTRLLAELTTVAGEAGFLCLIGHCIDLGDTPPPYLPLTEAFTRLAADRPDLVDELITSFPALTRLLPGRVGSATPADDRVERGDLFDSVRGALARLAAIAPVALFVEDVHWADQATRDLLGFLFTRLGDERLAIITSYRSDDLHRRHPLRRTLAEWSRLPAVSRVTLDPLGNEDVRELLLAMSADLTVADVDGIVRRADGNAFFAEELLAAVDRGDQLPWQLADLLLVRLDRMSDDARQVVRGAAVAGRRVSHEVLESAARMPARELEAALREAIDAHVLQLTSSGRGYTFRHALLAEAVYDDLLPGERVRLHAAYAAVLAADPGHRAAELARHALASHDLVTAFTASLAAGDEAMAVAAPQEALQHYEAALELAPRVPEARPDRAALILAAVEAAEAAGHVQRGQRLASRALESLPADADPLARATLLYAVVRAALGHEIGEDLFGTSTDALRLVPEQPPSALRARLLAVHGRVSLSLGHEADAEKNLREALTVGEAAGSRLAVSEAQTTLAVLERRKGDPIAAADLMRRAADEARVLGDHASELRSLFSLASLWHELTELDRSRTAFAEAHARAVEVGRPWDLFAVHARAMTGTLQYLQGDWDAALATLDTSREQPTGVAGAILRSTAMTVRGGRGDETLLDELDELRPFWPREGRIGLYAGFGALEIHEQRADVEAAMALIDELVEVLGRLWLDPWFLGRIQLSALGLATLSAAAATAPQSRRAELAARGVQLLTDGRASGERGLPSTRRMGREGRAWLARLEAESARLRWLTGHDAPSAEDLVTAWEQTVEAFDYGHVLQTARSRARLAEALRATGRATDALAAADAARLGAERLGAAPLLAGIRLLGTGRRAAADAFGLDALTERERGVLAELVDGRTNRQIAAKLFISEKTVSVHVSNILAKLGVRSRAEAAALARR